MHHDESKIVQIFQGLLTSWKFTEPSSWPEDFAIRRFLKKMEAPDRDGAESRRQKCFQDYISFDDGLRQPYRLLPRKWYLAREAAHTAVSRFRLAPVSFTNGSEVKATHGFNSLEKKLCKSVWHCTPGNFELWAKTAWETRSLKRATRKRFARTMEHDKRAIREFHRESWAKYKGKRDSNFLCFRRMLAVVTEVYHASRFSTVRKNNEVDRPIALEGLCNMLVQRRIGCGIKNLLKEVFGVDLDSLADKHRRLISDATKATIDLKNASDSVSLWLVDFLFPKWFTNQLYAARAPFLEGLDGEFYVLNKVSSMGAGFTFELMSFILLVLGLEHDKEFSVFGDDIIVANPKARAVIADLRAVGFEVNESKSFVDSKFRESCGANWHDDYGYIRSFDFWYPQSIHDCIVVYNKASLLGEVCPQFATLSSALLRAVPPALQGPRDITWQQVAPHGARGRDEDVLLSAYFRTGKSRKGVKVDDRRFAGVLRDYQLDSRRFPLKRRYFYGYKWVPKLASRSLDTLSMRRHWGKYYSYLHGARIVDDSVTGHGVWQKVTWLQVGQRAFRVKALVAAHSP